jgi:hypothetical protein
MPRSFGNLAFGFFRMNPRLAHLFMICSNIKLTGPAESMGLVPRGFNNEINMVRIDM